MAEIMTYADDTDQTQEISQHIVISRDKSVYVPEIIRKSIVYRDHNVECLTFDCPRYWSGIDISELNIYVNYIAEGQKKKKEDPGSFLCENVIVDEDNTDIFHFDWRITSNASEFPDKLIFLVCAKSVDAEGNENVHWNSRLCKDLEVQEGLEASDSIVKKYPDVIESILSKLGKQIELRNSGIAIQYRNAGENIWTDLVQLEDIKGDAAVIIESNFKGSDTTANIMEKTGEAGDKWYSTDEGVYYMLSTSGEWINCGSGENLKKIEDEISKLKGDLNNLSLGVWTDGKAYIFINGEKTGTGIELNGNSEPSIPDKIESLFSVNWLDTVYGIGDNTVSNYNAWAPNCSHYDADVDKVVFLQCHRATHTGAFTDSQLWAINPYNVMECEEIATFPVVNNKVPISFEIYNGVYYVLSTNKLYVSSDKGKTWDIKDVSIPYAYGLYIIDGVMYTGNDSLNTSNNGIYYKSNDMGVTWETKRFDFTDTYGDELLCSEAVFCKHNDELYATLRRQNTTGLLAHFNNGVWEVLRDDLPNVNSDCTLYSVEDNFVFCAIDRPNKMLYIGTINDTDFTIDVSKTLNFSKNTSSGDFHTPSYVYGNDFQMITFMIGSILSEYQSSMNVALVGYTDITKSKNISYNVVKNSVSKSDITETPYIGSPISTSDNGNNFSVTSGSVINSNARLMGTGKIIDDGFYRFSPISGEGIGICGAFNTNAYGYIGYDWLEYDGNYYSCIVKSGGSSTFGSGFLKLMTKAKPQLKVENLSEKIVTGENSEFVYPIYVENTIGQALIYATSYACTVSKADPSILS